MAKKRNRLRIPTGSSPRQIRKLKKLRKKARAVRVIRRRIVHNKTHHTKFNRRKRSIIYAGVGNRLPLVRAAALAGIARKTIYLWMTQGKDYEKFPMHYFFRKKVKQIQAQIEQESLDIIRRAQNGGDKIIDTKVTFGPKGTEISRRKKVLAPNWAAAAWFLERRYREHYGQDAQDAESEKTAEDLAHEIRDIAKELFDSVPLLPIISIKQEG